MEKLTNPSGQSIRIALLRFAPRYDNILLNVAMLERLFFKTVELQPDLILTPELAVSGYEFYKVLGKEWIKTDGPTFLEKFTQMAREDQVALVFDSPIYDAQSDKYYNAAIFIDEQGQVIGAHHKRLSLPGAEAWSSPGTEIKPASWRGQKIGFTDLRRFLSSPSCRRIGATRR